jgi:hypothetical protein
MFLTYSSFSPFRTGSYRSGSAVVPAARPLDLLDTNRAKSSGIASGQWRRGVRHDTTRLEGVWSQAGKTLASYLSRPRGTEAADPIQQGYR